MPIRPPQFDAVASALQPLMLNLPARTIAITGGMGVGKTTLGRFLAWYFNVTLVETDHYIAGPGPAYDGAEVRRIVEQRHSLPRPVIVEGLRVLPLAQQLDLVPDAVVWVTRRRVGQERMPRAHNPAAWGFARCPLHVVVVDPDRLAP